MIESPRWVWLTSFGRINLTEFSRRRLFIRRNRVEHLDYGDPVLASSSKPCHLTNNAVRFYQAFTVVGYLSFMQHGLRAHWFTRLSPSRAV